MAPLALGASFAAAGVAHFAVRAAERETSVRPQKVFARARVDRMEPSCWTNTVEEWKGPCVYGDRSASTTFSLLGDSHAEHWLARTFDHVEHTCERFRRVVLPRMTLATENDVRRPQAANSFKRHVVKWFGEDLEAGNQTSKHRANLARARALSIDCVVDQVNEQGYFKQ